MISSNHEWVRSSRCTPNGNCVEVQRADHTVRIRDSKSVGMGRLAFDRRRWADFLRAVTS
jgi:Domain of unknown function (DUF397)